MNNYFILYFKMALKIKYVNYHELHINTQHDLEEFINELKNLHSNGFTIAVEVNAYRDTTDQPTHSPFHQTKIIVLTTPMYRNLQSLLTLSHSQTKKPRIYQIIKLNTTQVCW
ncbi:hypothetical protein, partial [Klebsiella pneumoniae]|uniref:hypothetical protein n=1 Tax=Klebsiella pneumoniae TaxID=573 RepID=UPI001C8F9960